ncbi:hypothetical protein KIN20_006737 [Parelaphostrongylus tenuis]|uniref:Uncharacterized protein n=1 Tax=Parelaphostrongylus tenuis TaxID=148309 RepID=A0AAD5MKV2_PARTN|nr:hypothetical protein KIN20_006737 [Parelaphostrongylus tenuis]
MLESPMGKFVWHVYEELRELSTSRLTFARSGKHIPKNGGKICSVEKSELLTEESLHLQFQDNQFSTPMRNSK